MGKAKLSGVSGVYIIKHNQSDKVYVGSSLDLYSRIRVHKTKLKNGTHINLKLRNFCSKYGFEGFEFSVLELCDKNNILEREQYWMDYYKSYDSGFNISKTSSYPYKDLTQEQIEERKDRISKKRGRGVFVYDNKQLMLYFNSISECSRKLNINCSHIHNCCSNKEYNKKYKFNFVESSKEEISNYFEKELPERLSNSKISSLNNIKKTKSMSNNNLIVSFMIKEILSFEISEQLNNEVKSIFVYHKITKNITTIDSVKFDKDKYYYAPTQSLLQRWLREIHKIFIEIGYGFENNPVTYRVWISKFNEGYNSDTMYLDNVSELKRKQFVTYEEALEAGLKKALELI